MSSESSNKEPVIVCRCEDITLDEIRYWLSKGYTSLEELRRVLRLGMGPCQGRTCIPIVQREIARYTGKSMQEVGTMSYKPPSVGVEFSAYLDLAESLD